MRRGTIIASVVVAGVLVAMIAQLSHTGQLDSQRWTPFAQWPYVRYLLSGLGYTLEVGLTGAVLSLVLGTLLGLGRTSVRKWLSWPCTAVIEFFRSIPLLLLVYFFLIGLPSFGLDIDTFWQVTLAIILHAGAVFAEIVRAGVNSLDRGQFDAAGAIGLRGRQTMTLVVLPQVFRNLRPALVSQLIRTLKESSLGYVVSLAELLHNGKILGEYTGDFLQAFAVTAVIYIVINFALSNVANRLDRRAPRPVRDTP
jgi:glutamate transport system permease protein